LCSVSQTTSNYYNLKEFECIGFFDYNNCEMATNQIVDFSAWESSKENIQPLKTGRDAKTLAVLGGSNSTKALSEKLEKEKRFVQLLTT
jgi:hypothetical protein